MCTNLLNNGNSCAMLQIIEFRFNSYSIFIILFVILTVTKQCTHCLVFVEYRHFILIIISRSNARFNKNKSVSINL